MIYHPQPPAASLPPSFPESKVTSAQAQDPEALGPVTTLVTISERDPQARGPWESLSYLHILACTLHMPAWVLSL